MDIAQKHLHECLDVLEEQEVSLLSWGDCDGFFSEEEIHTILAQVLPEYAPEIVKIELLEHGMLFEVPHQQGVTAYRSRMGEAVHLYRNLRQWFHGQPLDRTRTLVSDYRFVRRPRIYPKRELDPHVLLNQWKEEAKLSEIELQAMSQLLQPLQQFRLSGFQSRGTIRICKAWQHHSSPSYQVAGPTGTIICAGTGSGKTLSFYLPALTKIVGDICTKPDKRVRILAIYPRKELLKDQFMETWSQCRKLDSLMNREVGRKVRIGAYFGDTPYNLTSALDVVNKQSINNLPFDLLRCGTIGCSGTMGWAKISMEEQVEELTCTRCGHRVGCDEVALTRQSLSVHPPDILFTTTEMLNQHLGNNYQNHLFGVGHNIKGPPLVLLDEVHTYGGNTGAQTAFLLRRWMQKAWCRPHFVGLSATLADAESFFGELIGADLARVELIQPKQDEIEDKGAEYLLALRGDPVSQTALLSTTIQATMLTRRILDTRQHGRSNGCWGGKTFIFTDDLDSTNRLYHQLCDAEGWKTSFRGLQPMGAPLAHLREPDLQQRKIDLGQNWRIAQDIGHTLSFDDRALVARTSSQDAGVDANAEVIVATASLEVGFNDPLVGAVIQHKAPRDVASYLQRKGRAGRPTIMRPWMLVILSEFGRDRVAFQRYEELISPEIKRQRLPLHNGHIQKMQAAMATLDWLSTRLGKTSIWSILKEPRKNASACDQVNKLVEEILSPGEPQEKYVSYLSWALGLDETALQRILWAPPRSIMMEFLPTLYRLLITNWSGQGMQWGSLTRNRSPLPQFIPDALFSNLNQPTLGITLQRGRTREEKWESLNFHQGLREFAPGRISKRYAIDSNYDADWLVPHGFIPLADMVMRVPFEVTEAFGHNLTFEGEVITEDGESLRVLSPHEIHTQRLPVQLNLTEKSNAFLQWRVAFCVTNQEALVHVPPIGSWQESLLDITFHTHGQMTPLEVIRYNTGSLASLRFKRGSRTHVNFDWQMDGDFVGIGDKQWVDGTKIRFKINDGSLTQLMADPLIMSALRPIFFHHCVSELDSFENDPFTANWVTECYLAALASELVEVSSRHPMNVAQNVQDGLAALRTAAGAEKLRNIPLSLFQPDEPQIEEANTLLVSLNHHFASQVFVEQIHHCADVLWQTPDFLPGFTDWLRIILANTMAAASLQMLYVLLPDVEEQAVIADANWNDNVLEVWLTETEAGGSGIITRLNRAYFEDPVYLLNILVRCLQPSDYEQIDSDLFALLEMLENDVRLRQALDGVRYAQNHNTRRQATCRMQEILKEAGFVLSHSFISVLFSRVLRPGSDQGTDGNLLNLLRKWNELEASSGLEWKLNIAAHTLACSSFKEEADPTQLFERFCLYQGLLWPRGNDIRQSELSYYNPFSSGPNLTERLLGAILFDDRTPQVIYHPEEWLPTLHDAIRQAGQVDLVIGRSAINEISVIISCLQTEPIEHLGLFLYPRIRGVRRLSGQVLLRVEMAEILL